MAERNEYLADARVDFDESFDWYAKRSSPAAIGFAAAVDEAIQNIAAHPTQFQLTYGGCRYAALKRYPFRIVFREATDCLTVVAIAHAKRRPGYWRRRI